MKRKDTQSIIHVKPNALKQNINKLFETFFQQQQQFKKGYRYLGEGGFQKKIE